MNNTIGLTIPNPDFTFEIKKLKNIDKYLLMITKREEIIVYKEESNTFNQKYVLLTHPQKRKSINDVFILDGVNSLLVTIFP
jgi:hypothetical protein